MQLREGGQAYNYQREHPSREDALRAARAAGRRLANFNMEQQGDIARDYYALLKQGQDVSAWELFMAELRQ